MLPMAHTKITVKRPDQTADGYDPNPSDPVTVATDVRAEITSQSGTVTLANGQRVTYSARLHCDPCDVQEGDEITDAKGRTYQVRWCQPREGFGLDHVVGYLQQVKGAS